MYGCGACSASSRARPRLGWRLSGQCTQCCQEILCNCCNLDNNMMKVDNMDLKTSTRCGCMNKPPKANIPLSVAAIEKNALCLIISIVLVLSQFCPFCIFSQVLKYSPFRKLCFGKESSLLVVNHPPHRRAI